VGALGQYLEAAGVATTQISLIREHTEAINPPRALWVSFMLGRPFGVPNDARFQERVLRAALRLLEAPQGPVLQDYPEDAPEPMSDVAEGQVCPVSFAHELDEGDIRALFLREVEALVPWYDLARERRGHSAVGLRAGPIGESAALVGAFVKGEHVAPPEGLTLGQTLKLACEDVRAYYYEAAAARPGDPDAKAIDQWFWRETAAGRVFLALQKLSAASDDESVRRLAATSIVPRSVLHDQAKA
jgi:hypothetical protein